MTIKSIIKEYLEEVEAGVILSKKGKRFRPNSIRALRNVLSLAPELPVNDKSILKFKASLEGRKPNSVASILALVGSALKAKGYNLRMPSVQKVENAIVVLPDSFISEFMANRVEHPVWEVSAIMLATSLRISDAVSLVPSNFQDGFLVKPNIKTGSVTQMPIPKAVSDFIGENIAKHGSVFCSKVSERGINKGFKSFMMRYEYMNKIYSSLEYDSNGEPIALSKPLYEWITPHSLRKSAITSMLANGVSVEHVKFCSGHSAKSSSFDRYVGFVETRYGSELSNYQKQIYG